MQIVSVIIPFFALVLVGFLAARCRLLPLEAVPGLNAYVLYFALTALLFQLGARTPVVELVDPTMVGLWLVVGMLVMLPALALARRGGHSWLDAALGALIAVLPNSGFMGLPLIAALVGPESAGPIITSLLVDIVLLQSIGIALSQRGRAQGAPRGRGALWAQVRASAHRVVRNPMPWAIVLGALWGVTGRQLATPVDDVLGMLAASATPVALFTIGAVLARQQMTTSRPGRAVGPLSADVLTLTGLKLVAHPVLVWLVGRTLLVLGLPLSDAALTVLVLVAALPSATNASMLAERLGADNGRIASVILASTALGFGSFTVAVALTV